MHTQSFVTHMEGVRSNIIKKQILTNWHASFGGLSLLYIIILIYFLKQYTYFNNIMPSLFQSAWVSMDMEQLSIIFVGTSTLGEFVGGRDVHQCSFKVRF